MSGAKLAMQYGYVPCRLGLCGPKEKEKQKIILAYLKGNKKLKPKITEIIKQFKGAYPYYKLIAKSNKLSPLDKKVVEAYWLGNELLDKVKFADLKAMIMESFVPLGKVPVSLVEKLSKNSFPYHTFHVLYLGSVTGTLKTTQKSKDICRTGWGKVKKLEKDKIVIEYQPLKFGKNISLGGKKEKTVLWNKDILSQIKIGDWVSTHWGHAIERLNAEQLKNLQYYTKKALL